MSYRPEIFAGSIGLVRPGYPLLPEAPRAAPQTGRPGRTVLAVALVATALIAAVLTEAARQTRQWHARAPAPVTATLRARTVQARLPWSVGSPAATLPFAPDRRDRLPRPGEVPGLYEDGYACSTGCRPVGAQLGWPLAPFHRQHPIRAGLNELRTGSMHVGIDIQARDGAAVYAVQPGVAQVLEADGPNARIRVGNYVYWHITPALRSGQLVVAFSTVLGHVMAGYGHIAFSELDSLGRYVNPLRPGGTVLVPYVDHARPVIGPPAVARDGQVVAAVYSPQTFVRRTTYLTPVLAPAALAYRLYDSRGSAVSPLAWAFRGTRLLPWTERSLIYAPGAHAPGYTCFATRAVCVPRWSFRVAGGLAPPLRTWLAPGRYRLTLYAFDWAGNITALDTAVTLTPAGWQAVGRFPQSLAPAGGVLVRRPVSATTSTGVAQARPAPSVPAAAPAVASAPARPAPAPAAPPARSLAQLTTSAPASAAAPPAPAPAAVAPPTSAPPATAPAATAPPATPDGGAAAAVTR